MTASQANEKAAPMVASPPATHSDLISLDKDVAIELVGEHAREIDPEIEARVIRKIDWFLIPAMIVGMQCVNHNIPTHTHTHGMQVVNPIS